MRKYLLFFVVIAVVAFGCKQRVVTQPEAQQQDTTKVSKISEDKVGKIKSEDVSSKYLEEKEGMFEDILFDFDKYNIKSLYEPTLKAVSSWMLKNSGASLSIEGHCDERGTNEYNLALGDRRAKAVKDYLVSLGVPSAKLQTLSYGEEKPQCTAHSESCWSKNRRAHFVILQGK